MKKIFFYTFLCFSLKLNAQQINATFNSSFKKFLSDNSLKHASVSLYVINNTTGKTVTSFNTEIGLAPASCQKVITASTAFELLHHDYIYKTTLGYTGKIINGVLNGNLIVKGSGDPTLGSWRYNKTTEESIISESKDALSRYGINEIIGHVYTDENLWSGEVIPGGWIWEDIGNYYGAGARAFNWRENQYDLYLKSGNHIGDCVQIVSTTPSFIEDLRLRSVATSAEKGSGDNSYIFMPMDQKYGYVRGTIPIKETNFTISGAMPNPAKQFAITLEASIKKIEPNSISYTGNEKNFDSVSIFYTHDSPPLDSVVYWFLKRSINLYGEALIKTLAFSFTKAGVTDSGVNVIKNFWKTKGIESSALHIIDGSGLSPSNRITTSALVSVMQYAKKQSWFPSFYYALPEINGIKMKSGSIEGVVSYTGYIKSSTGIDYTFAFIVNNFDGNANDVRIKMWKLLDVLK